MHNSVDATLVHRGNGYYQSSVTHRRSGVGLDVTRLHGTGNHFAHHRVYRSRCRGELRANVTQFGRRIVFDISESVNDAVDERYYFGKRFKA